MDIMKSEYEFLDFTDVKEADRSSLHSALFKPTEAPKATFKIAAAESAVDLSSSSGSLGAAGAVSVSRSVESAGSGDMAPHSPARVPPAPPHPPYAAPPPAYPPPHHQWPVAPPNVYVSQVTANVNVHGYMGQYYQPQPQFGPPQPAPPQDRGRTHRRDRRGKRPPSPPQHPPYYLHQYPQYYHAAQAQGAPLYHMPVYQPVVYGHYPYPPYYQEYQMPVEGGEPDKGPEEYPPEVVMEQEAVDAYYANAHYAPPYGPPVDAGVEYMPPVYLPPPPHVAPALPHHHQHMPQPPPQPHQFNVHAKNFVLGQGKSFVSQDKQQQPPSIEAPIVSAANVEALPIKDLKIAHKGPSSPKHNERPVEVSQAKPIPSPTEKPKTLETAKPAWVPENKVDSNFVHQQLSAKPFVPPVTIAQIAANKLPPAASKPIKGPAAPFSGNKQPPKPSVPQTIVPVQQAATTTKPPFANRQKREGTANRSPSSEQIEIVDRSAEHKREPPLPASKAPMPISITLPAAGQPLIVANKPPFGHSRKTQMPEPPPVPQPPPPAPTASDFPPPPTPRNRGELPPPVVAPQPQPAPGKSWASLFSNKVSSIAPPLPPPGIPLHPVEEPTSPTTAAPPVANIQKPVAKVQPYDASPLAQSSEKPIPRAPMPVVPPVTVAPVVSYSEKALSYSEKALSYSEKAVSYSEKAVSYSEKTSANVSPAASSPVAHAKQPVVQPEIKEVPPQKEVTPAAPVQPSPYCDDPNSYRMGEFLSKYQLDNRAVSVLPRGLTNRSNYCYVNAILQALIACPPFYNMLKALPYQTRRGKSSTPVIDSMVELCYEFSPIPAPPRNARGAGVPAPQVPAGPPLEGGAGLRVLRALRPFPGSQEGRQEDAEEFLGCLLNSLNDEMLELMKLVEPEEPKENAAAQTNGVITQEATIEEDDDDEWKVMGPKNRGAVERRWAARRTPVSDIFRGKTRVRLHRATHHDVTDAVQPFFTLQLDIERACNVKDALELLAGKDTLEGVADAWQQLSIEQLPVVLLLHLKCFQLDAEGHTAKIVKPIDFPMDLKIDPKIMSSKQKYTSKQRMYKLFAVVYHEGVEAVKGHYVTDTYHGQSGWIRYDDATVTQVNDGLVLKAKPPRMPYLLMYRRQDTLPAHRAKPE